MDVSNADRVVFPDDGITKGEVVDYYDRVSGRIFPFVEGRALTVQRFPQGIGGQGFMQKNAPAHFPDDLFDRFETPKEGGGTTVYPVIRDAAAMPYLANQGVITFHIPPVTVKDLAHPDWAVWDLDPPEGGVEVVREAARILRSFLEDYGIVTVPMTSGSKGYHLRALLHPTVEMEVVADVARGIAALAAEANPELLTLAFLKKERGDRVFVDWLRNHAFSTAVAPWSLRARSGATVAVPLAWDEIEEIAPDGVGLYEIGPRLELDPWADLEPIDLSPASKSVKSALDEAGITLEPFDRFRS
ncbi:MAG: non-homologous end-joining DNA ligase [Acidimicrobiia bacterium]